MLRAVSANLGCAGPPAAGAAPVEAAHSWSRQVRNRVDLAFLQEVPDGLVGEWEDDGFQAARPTGPRFRVRSALLWRREVARVEPLRLATTEYHGSYLSAARLALDGFPTPVACVSFHASPRPVEQRYLNTWECCGSDLPARRHGGGRHDNELFDSDMVVASLKQLARDHPVLAAGDLNECQAWDNAHGENWWEPLTAAAGAQPGELEFSLSRIWKSGERPTRFNDGVPEYQLDHILASPTLGARLGPDADVDPAWSTEPVATGGRSDHAPIWFTLE